MRRRITNRTKRALDSGRGPEAAAGYVVPKGSRPGGLLDYSKITISLLDNEFSLDYAYRLPLIFLLINYKKALLTSALIRLINSAYITNQFLDGPIHFDGSNQTINYNEMNNLINCNDRDQYALKYLGWAEVSGCLRVLPAGVRCPLPILSTQKCTENERRKRSLSANKKQIEENEDANGLRNEIDDYGVIAMSVRFMLDLYYMSIFVRSGGRSGDVMRDVCAKSFLFERCELLNKELMLTNSTVTIRATARNKRWPVYSDSSLETLSR